MQNDAKLSELVIVLDAIRNVRQEWVSIIDLKTKEMAELFPQFDAKEIRSAAMTHPDVHEAFQRLISLYGVVGEGAQSYAQALNSVAPEAEVIPLRKAA